MNPLKISVMFLFPFIFFAQSNPRSAQDEITVEGELIDVCSSMGMMNMGMMNMMNMGKTEEHKNTSMMSMGPLGIRTKDGVIYSPVIMADNDMMNMDMMNMHMMNMMGKTQEHTDTPMTNLRDYIGQKVMVTGTVLNQCMMNGIKIKTIEKIQ